jgi:hypothetical protein
MRGNTSAPRPPAASVTDVAADTPRAAPPGRGAPVEVRTAPLARAATPSQPELADAKAPLAQDAAAAPRAAARPRTLASAKSIGTTQRGPAAAPAPTTAQAASASPPSAPRGALGGAALGSIALGSATTNAPTTPRAEAPRRPKQTETGLTPTSPKGRAPITTPPVAATPAPKPTAPSEPPPRAPQIDDDDEPSTNIRDVTGVGKNPLLQTPDARVHRTLVMEETKARQQAAEILGVAVASPAMGPNAMAQAGRAPTALPHGMHGGHGSALHAGGSPPPGTVAATQLAAAPGLAATQPQHPGLSHVPSAQPSPRAPSKSMPPPSPDGRALAAQRMLDEPSDGGLGQVKSTMRMPGHEAHAELGPGSHRLGASSENLRMLPAGTWNDPTRLTRTKPEAAPKSGVLGFFEELPGTTGLIIGIGLGLGIAGGAILAFILLR